MKAFSVIAQNDMLEQINKIDDLSYASEMYKYLAYEMNFPNVQLIDNVTGEVLMHRVVETNVTEYIAPIIQALAVETPTEEIKSEQVEEDDITKLSNENIAIIEKILEEDLTITKFECFILNAIIDGLKDKDYTLVELKKMKRDMTKKLEEITKE